MSDERLTDDVLAELLEKAEALGCERWTTWCDGEPSLRWLCNDHDTASIVTLDDNRRPARTVMNAMVTRTPEEEASATTEPSDLARTASELAYIASANPATVSALVREVQGWRKEAYDSTHCHCGRGLTNAWSEPACTGCGSVPECCRCAPLSALP